MGNQTRQRTSRRRSWSAEVEIRLGPRPQPSLTASSLTPHQVVYPNFRLCASSLYTLLSSSTYIVVNYMRNSNYSRIFDVACTPIIKASSSPSWWSLWLIIFQPVLANLNILNLWSIIRQAEILESKNSSKSFSIYWTSRCSYLSTGPSLP